MRSNKHLRIKQVGLMQPLDMQRRLEDCVDMLVKRAAQLRNRELSGEGKIRELKLEPVVRSVRK